MTLYIIIILVSTVIIAVPNAIFRPGGEPWYMYLIMTVVAVAASLLIDGIVAFVGRRLPKKWMDPNKKIFHTSDREMKFYEKIGVRKWKDKVPELGGFTSFHKNKLSDPWNNEYVERYMLEACYGVIIHLFSPFFGFLIVLLDYKMYTGWSWMWLTIMIPVAIVNAVLIVMPAFILKYNLPKLKMLWDINMKNKKKREEQEFIFDGYPVS